MHLYLRQNPLFLNKDLRINQNTYKNLGVISEQSNRGGTDENMYRRNRHTD
ncbi:protein of unknown function [Pseudodesulfovibrio profundus]|uniref:Uncharacterized protein n=1 Tax=Pseudodesulfovibrio profundus TaxID=57320 RepID=A0A2C8F9Y9_9BACT|nr:protein of unknown function [Pseudodesulfovibrio profundus]